MNVVQRLWIGRRQVATTIGRHPSRALRTYHRLVAESVGGDYSSHGDLAEADCVVVFCSSPLANEDMAWTYLPELRQQYPRLPFICSPEVLRLYQRFGQRSNEPLHGLATSEGTYESAVAAAGVMHRLGFSRPGMVALDRHVPRMDAVFRGFGYATVVPDDLSSIRLTTTDPGHDLRWRRSQPLAVGLYVLLGLVALDS